MNMAIATGAMRRALPPLQMADRRFSRRWFPQGRVSKLALTAAAAGLGYMAVVQSVAMVLQKQSPEQAHALAPTNGFITGELAGKLSTSNGGVRNRAQAVRLAQLALRQDPTAIDGAVTLALNALISGNTAKARHLFAYSEMLSRRNLPTQLWDINDPQNGVDTVLFHYDIALRTSQNASALLFPVLASAIGDPANRNDIVNLLARRPPWGNGLIDYLVANDVDPASTGLFFRALSERGVPIFDGDSAGLINTLIDVNQYEQAWRYYASIHPETVRNQSRDPNFKNDAAVPAPFDWVPINLGAISSSIQRGSNGGVLAFSAPPSIGGSVVEQTELLRPGDYILSGQTEDISQPDDARPYWSLSCRQGRELGRTDVPNSTRADGRFSGRFTVPADCPVQILTLTIRPSSKISGVSGQVVSALLKPVE